MSEFKYHDSVSSIQVRDLLHQVANREITVDCAVEKLRTPAFVAQIMSDFAGEVELLIDGFDQASYWEAEGNNVGPSRKWVSPLLEECARGVATPSLKLWQRSALWVDTTAPQLVTSDKPDEVWVGIDCIGEGTLNCDTCVDETPRRTQEKYVFGATLKLHGKSSASPVDDK